MLTTSAFLALAMQCAPSIHPDTLTPIVKTESSFNPYAIGVSGKVLPRQPQSLDEAVLAVKKLVAEGADFSIGLGQINRQHFDVSRPEPVFEPCTNLRMAARELQACYVKASKADPDVQSALHKAISCYYSGNPKRGFKAEPEFGGSSHVQRVLANAGTATVTVPALEGGSPEPNKHQRAQAPASTVEPTYESWDVLRQYPRYLPPAPPSVSAPPASPAPPAESPEEPSIPPKEDQ
ncbi:lytic transglycosylase domain-containing protein (plasmid) [Pseudomonas savastanoi pv. phaseolicola]|uniref:lytic transglycosylase domain-containing protein n=1 Tax=Pseudomonas TaxID=286 RepID=UPI0006B95852|nr:MULTISPECIES: lytic transglycosylase domain-containing protein [Pseudomonas]KPB46197.1 Type IV secretion system assembly protein VirB1 [Pseudomonas savastanoi pv. phaseolicola]KPB51786.1 Type IV secretion system assembly protein VirB1 [Pseudomonas savastanoi pv. phaseolicola]QDW03678.1 lytic transglycosylase domain-containing protein [Pseudomonas sp. KBS0707]RMQ63719.1 Type IV secretion system assembly protein VirB1 [Pseudomonas savastanoi pv. glycinea]